MQKAQRIEDNFTTMDRFLKSVGQTQHVKAKNKAWLIEKTKLMIKETEKCLLEV